MGRVDSAPLEWSPGRSGPSCVALVALMGLLAYLTPSLRERFESYWLFPLWGCSRRCSRWRTRQWRSDRFAASPQLHRVALLRCWLRGHRPHFATAYADYAIFARSSPTLPATQYMAWLADRDILRRHPIIWASLFPKEHAAPRKRSASGGSVARASPYRPCWWS